MVYFLIGFRNIVKNIRKNLLTLLMISFGMTALFIYSGSNTQIFDQFRESVIRDQYGHFQLHQRGFQEFRNKSPYDFLITDYPRLAQILLSDTDIDYVAPRLSFSGIMADDDKSIIVKGFGGDAIAESRMQYGKVNQGTFLEAGENNQAVIGELALKKISSSLNESLTVLVSMKGGGISAADFRITGTKKSFGENDIENQMFIVAHIADVQALLDMQDTVDTIIVHLKDERSFQRVQKRLISLSKEFGLELQTWDKLAIFYERSRQVFMMNQHILTIIILIISIFIIINTMYMTYMERVREIGTIRAIGTSKYQVGMIFLNESIILALAGGLFGILIALIIAGVVNFLGGIYHPSSVFNEEPYYTFIQPEMATIVLYMVLFVLVSAIASVLISIRSWRLSIADSLRWN